MLELNKPCVRNVRNKKLHGTLRLAKLKSFSSVWENFTNVVEFDGSFPCSQDLTRSIQSTPSHPISWGLISILFSHLSLRPPYGLFPWSVPTKTLYVPFLPSYLPHALHPFHYSWFGYHPNNIWWEKSLRCTIWTIPSPLLLRRS